MSQIGVLSLNSRFAGTASLIVRGKPTLAVLFVFTLMSAAVAQIDPAAGVIPFSTQAVGAYDSIDLASSNILITVPVREKAGKVPFSFKVVANSHAYAFPSRLPTNIAVAGVFTGLIAGQPFVMDLGARLSYDKKQGSLCNGSLDQIQSNFVVIDSSGTSHPLGQNVQTDTNGCMSFPPPPPTNTLDGSGYGVVFTARGNPPTTLIYDRYKNYESVSNVGGDTATDPDGVQASSSGGAAPTYTDTLGQPAITVTGGSSWTKYGYTDSEGNPQAVTVNFSLYNQRTNFGCSGLIDAGPYSNVSLPSSIVLADGGTINISYEITPGYSGYVTGRISTLTLPSGGSISYLYQGSTMDSTVQSTGRFQR